MTRYDWPIQVLEMVRLREVEVVSHSCVSVTLLIRQRGGEQTVAKRRGVAPAGNAAEKE
jgi:hypothetical protein